MKTRLILLSALAVFSAAAQPVLRSGWTTTTDPATARAALGITTGGGWPLQWPWESITNTPSAVASLVYYQPATNGAAIGWGQLPGPVLTNAAAFDGAGEASTAFNGMQAYLASQLSAATNATTLPSSQAATNGLSAALVPLIQSNTLPASINATNALNVAAFTGAASSVPWSGVTGAPAFDALGAALNATNGLAAVTQPGNTTLSNLALNGVLFTNTAANGYIWTNRLTGTYLAWVPGVGLCESNAVTGTHSLLVGTNGGFHAGDWSMVGSGNITAESNVTAKVAAFAPTMVATNSMSSSNVWLLGAATDEIVRQYGTNEVDIGFTNGGAGLVQINRGTTNVLSVNAPAVNLTAAGAVQGYSVVAAGGTNTGGGFWGNGGGLTNTTAFAQLAHPSQSGAVVNANNDLINWTSALTNGGFGANYTTGAIQTPSSPANALYKITCNFNPGAVGASVAITIMFGGTASGIFVAGSYYDGTRTGGLEPYMVSIPASTLITMRASVNTSGSGWAGNLYVEQVR